MNTLNLAGYSRLCASARVLAAFVVILTGSIVAFGQQTTGSIVGTVKDQQGAVVNTANVTATNLDTGFSRSAPANSYGEYRIDYLPVGRYTLEAKAPNFERFVQQNLALDVDQTLAVEINLVVGAQTLTVTVTEAPPLVNTSDAVLGRTIEPDEIIGLPLVNRNVYSELSLTPGVMANNMSATANPSGSPGFSTGLPTTRGRLLPGWRQQHNRYAQLRKPVAQPRRSRRVSRRDQRILGAIRPILRRCRLGYHKVGNKSVSWRIVRVQPQHRFQRLGVGPGPGY